MKILNKKFVYLISPNKIKHNSFFVNLNLILKTNKVSFFQLRLKNENLEKKILNLLNFSTFRIKFKKKRIGRNPKTNEVYDISERNVINFKASKKLTVFLNE